jgi:fatty-acid desaturase
MRCIHLLDDVSLGAYMGFMFGVLQMILWAFYSAGWVLPAFGFVVGAITNWLALKVTPYHPIFDQ